MAIVAKSGVPSLATQLPAFENQLVGIAAEAIAAGDAIYVFGVDAMTKMPLFKKAKANTGSAGFAYQAARLNQSVTALRNVQMHYGSGLTPGTEYFLSGATFGALDTVAPNAGNQVAAVAITDTVIDVYVTRKGSNS